MTSEELAAARRAIYGAHVPPDRKPDPRKGKKQCAVREGRKVCRRLAGHEGDHGWWEYQAVQNATKRMIKKHRKSSERLSR